MAASVRWGQITQGNASASVLKKKCPLPKRNSQPITPTKALLIPHKSNSSKVRNLIIGQPYKILKYAKDCQTNKVYNFRYKKSKNPDAYFRRHETELTLFDGALNMLKRFLCVSLSLQEIFSFYQILIPLIVSPHGSRTPQLSCQLV